jgi:alkylhydroperoxidase/carboxymuconolactone decarboxylase family protein YurZ
MAMPVNQAKKESSDADDPAVAAREQVRPIAPKLIDLADRVVYGDVWELPGLSKRDRSLISNQRSCRYLPRLATIPIEVAT